MTLSLSTVVSLVLVALLAGVVDAIGGGGGLVTLPALLAAGLPPPLALGTNKGQSVFGSGAALLRFERAGLIDRRRAALELAAGAAGSAGGATLVLLLSPQVLRPVVLVMLVVAAVVLGLRRPSEVSMGRVVASRPLWIALAIALALGAYDGFFGPGTGTFLILAYVWLFGARLQQASADAKVVNFGSNLAAVVLFSVHGTILWTISLPMAAGQLLGGFAGAHLVVRRGDRLVRFVALIVAVGLVIKLLIDTLHS